MSPIAVQLDEAKVKIVADTRDGERQAAQAGRRFGKAFADGADQEASRSDLADKLARDVEQASARVEQARKGEAQAASGVEAAELRLSRARDTQADAAGRVAVAEQRLQELRDSGNAKASQLLAAENAVESARRKLTQASTQVTAAEQASAQATQRLAGAQQEAADATDRHTSAQRALQAETDRTGASVERLSARFRRLGNDGDSIGTRIGATLKSINLDFERITGRSLNIDFSRLVAGAAKAGAALAHLAGLAAGSYAALGGGVMVISAVGSALAHLAGLAAALPAALGVAGLAVGALKVGFSGFGDAMKAVGEDATKFEEAIADLAPAAQETARAIRSLVPAWDDLKLDVQQKLFAGLGPVVRDLGATYLPILQDSLGRVANGFNLAGHELGVFFAQSKTVGDLQGAMKQVANEAAAATGAIKPLAAAFTDLFVVGAEYMPRLGESITDLATRFAEFISNARNAGDINRWIDQGIVAAQQFGSILANLGGAIGGVFSAANQVSGGFMNTLVQLTAQLNETVNSVEGQDSLRAFFAGAKEAVSALLPVVGGVVQALGVLGPVLQQIGIAAGPIIGQLLNDLVAGLQAAAPGVAEFALGFLKAVEALSPLLPLLGQLIGALGSGLGTTLTAVAPLLSAVANALAFMGPVLAPIVAGLAPIVVGLTGLVKIGMAVSKTITAITTAWRILSLAFALSPIGLVVTLIAGLVAALIYAWNNSETFRNIVIGVFEAVKNAIGAAIDFIIGVVSKMGDFLAATWETISAAATATWTAIKDFFVGIWETVSAAFTTAWEAITSFLTGVWQSIVDFARPIWEGLAAFFTTIWNVIFEIFRWAAAILLAIFFTFWNPIWELTQTVWNAITEFLSAAWNTIVEVATTVWAGIVAFFTALWTPVAEFFTSVWDGIVAQLTAVWDMISSAASTVWNAIVAVITTVTEAISSVISSVWNAIVGFLLPIWERISSVAQTVWNAVSSVISTVMNAIWGVISSVWNTIAGFFTSVWNTISGAVSAGANRVWDFLVGLFNRIKGVAGEAINWLVNAGRNIVTGLWNGIVAMGSWLYNKILGWIKSVVPGPILQFLGIASPSKWARDVVGRMIPRGLAIGIEADSSKVERSAHGLAATVGDALSDGVSSISLTGVGEVVTAAVSDAGKAAERVLALLDDRGGRLVERLSVQVDAVARPVVDATVTAPAQAPVTVRPQTDAELVAALRALIDELRDNTLSGREVTIDVDINNPTGDGNLADAAQELRKLSTLGVFA